MKCNIYFVKYIKITIYTPIDTIFMNNDTNKKEDGDIQPSVEHHATWD